MRGREPQGGWVGRGLLKKEKKHLNIKDKTKYKLLAPPKKIVFAIRL